jgi:hypothetical protein
LLTENHSECGAIKFEDEVLMYCEILKKNCIPGSVIFLKSHPGEILLRNDAIKLQMKHYFELVELDIALKRFPIELWGGLISECEIICMSYPIISLKYLYNKDVIQPMNKQLITEWFPKSQWLSYLDAIDLYEKPLQCINSWDGKSLLWGGS